jgi:hypothetical protein
MNRAIKGNYRRSGILKYLGCSIAELKSYLEQQFTAKMTWENYGMYWSMDHILPCCSFNLSDEQEIKKCFHFSNLQPLTVIDNCRKSGKFEWMSDHQWKRPILEAFEQMHGVKAPVCKGILV